jgi:hypothetical protein
VGDTTNWEFAAAVAAVTMGLGGLLLFTIIGTIGSWRVFDRAARAADEAAKSSVLVQGLAREIAAREAATGTAAGLALEAKKLSELRQQSQALIDQQALLNDAVRNLVEAGVLKTESSRELKELVESIQRVDTKMTRMAADVANLSPPKHT